MLDLSCICYQLGQDSDIILAGLAAVTALVGGIPEAVSLGVEGTVGQQQSEPVGVHALVKGHISRLVGGISSETVKGNYEGRLTVYKFQRRDHDRAVPSFGVVDVVDLAAGSLHKAYGSFQNGAFRERLLLVVVLGPLLLIGEGRLHFRSDHLKFLYTGVPIIQVSAKGRDFALQFSVLGREGFKGLFERLGLRLQFRYLLVGG